MDKQGVGKDMWTSSQNAQLDHIPNAKLPFEKNHEDQYQGRKPGQRRPVAYQNVDSFNKLKICLDTGIHFSFVILFLA